MVKPQIYAISAYQISAQQFFKELLESQVDLLLDVRLKNQSQLCGFTKKADLAFFVPQICKAKYVHDLKFAPEAGLLDRYVKHWITWEEYARRYKEKMEEQDVEQYFWDKYGHYKCICMLGTETKQRRSHTEVLLQILK